MTREEAINEIKSWAIPSKNGREVLETLIPELRENEDESLKNKSGYYKAGKFWKASTLWNATKNKIPQRVSNRYILQECTWNIGNLQDFANEVKNVQEVSLDYPIILDMNGNIIDGAHRVVKAYLEGKDIDIVYIGDDEWPEPDYDEEKAVKESEDERIIKWIVNLLHKLHYDPTAQPMALKAIEYLEKQRENPKSTDSIPSDCTAGAKCEDRDSKYGVFPEDVIVVARACEKLEAHGYPELAHALKNVNLYTKPVDYEHEMWKNCEANFEGGKKEVIEHPEKYGLHKEQKQAQTSEEKEYIRTIKSIISDFIRDKKPENLAYYQRIYDWLDERHVPFSCGHENGKSADCVFSKQEYESHPIISTDTTSVKPVEFDGKTLLYTADKSYQIGFRDGVASVKPAEWSEEDEEMMADIIDSLEYAYPYDNEFRIAWLKSLRPQPKKELSIEKAIQWLDDTFYFLDNSSGRGRDCEITTHDFDSLEEMYDSFRKAVIVDSEPHWKPSEEQMEALDKARRFIPYNCDALESLYVDLKKL